MADDVAQVGAVEGECELAEIGFEVESTGDVGSDTAGGRGCQGEDGDAGEAMAEFGYLEV